MMSEMRCRMGKYCRGGVLAEGEENIDPRLVLVGNLDPLTDFFVPFLGRVQINRITRRPELLAPLKEENSGTSRTKVGRGFRKASYPFLDWE